MKNDGLVGSEHLSTSNSENSGISDISSSTGNNYSDWFFEIFSAQFFVEIVAKSLGRFFEYLLEH